MARSANKALADAYTEIRRGRLDEAEAILRPLIQDAAGDPRLHGLLAVLYEHRGELIAAIRELQRVLISQPEHVGSWVNLAGMSDTGSPARAAALWRRAFLIDPLERAVYQAWLRTPGHPGRRRVAIRAALLDPSNSLALTVLANEMVESLKPWNAPAMARRATRAGPMIVHTWSTFARTLDRVEIRDGVSSGKLALMRAVLLEPGNAISVGEQGWLALKTGALDRAQLLLGSRLVASGANQEQRLRAAYRLLYAESGATAARHFSEISESVEDPRQRLTLAAMASWANGDADAADRSLEAILSDPKLNTDRRPRDGTGDMLRVGPSFHRQLDAPSSVEPPPTIERLHTGPAKPHGTVFWCCDDLYFRRYAPILFANARNRPDWQFHLHLLAPTDREEVITFGQRSGITISAEPIPQACANGAARLAFCSSVRLERAWSLLNSGDCRQIAIADVDARLIGDLSDLMALLDQVPLAMIDMGSAGAPPWMRFPAGLTLFSNRNPGLRVLDRAARYVAHFLASGAPRWRLDQCALFASMWHERPATIQCNLAIQQHVRFLSANDEAAAISRVLNRMDPDDQAFLTKIMRTDGSAPA
ncbi:MAG: tetratricopeptide repeat protein [Rhodospirillaceae bacterium]|nr:tetratricopeptide repeat protein [Rhodospirillaceae bacterium]MBT6138694.1 tetratricopeptide repeat protein [Rhodospirillaceae bacterium]